MHSYRGSAAVGAVFSVTMSSGLGICLGNSLENGFLDVFQRKLIDRGQVGVLSRFVGLGASPSAINSQCLQRSFQGC